MRSPIFQTGTCAALAAAAVAVACATPRTRDLPPESAASPRADVAPPLPVGAVLEEDPPLPGDASARWDRWPGLAREAPAGHAGHGSSGEHDAEDADRDPAAGKNSASSDGDEAPPEAHDHGHAH
jgi:hypothetical protein